MDISMMQTVCLIYEDLDNDTNLYGLHWPSFTLSGDDPNIHDLIRVALPSTSMLVS